MKHLNHEEVGLAVFQPVELSTEAREHLIGCPACKWIVDYELAHNPFVDKDDKIPIDIDKTGV